MDFALTEEQQAIFDMALAFGREHIAPFAREWEREGTIPKALWPKVAELGLGGIYVGEDHGGSGLSRLDATLVFEALAMSCPAVGSFLSIHNMCGGMIDKFGSEESKAKWLPSLTSMEKVFSYCLTEPGSGSDAAALRTRAERTNEGWVLNGTKAFISGGGYSDVYVTMVRTGEDGPKGISTVIVEDGAKGLSFGGLEDKMGWRAQPTAQVQFDDCAVPAENLLGEEGMGLKIALSGLEGGRIGIASQAVGMARAAFEAALAYSKDRSSFGQPIFQHQAVQFKLAEMATQIEVARQMIWHAASLKDAGRPCLKEAAMAKLFATEMAERVCSDAIQVHGGYGYVSDFPVERIYRDVRVCQIYEGTSEVQKILIGRALA